MPMLLLVEIEIYQTLGTFDDSDRICTYQPSMVLPRMVHMYSIDQKGGN